MSPRLRLALAATAVAFAAADTYVVVLALPDMMAGVGLQADELHRAAPIVSGFLLGYVAVLPLIGRLADLAGRTPVLVGSLLLFAVGSLITASSYELGWVVAGRFLQGVGGGGLVPATLGLVADLWPPRRRGLPLGVVGAVQELGSVLGPLLGAVVLALADWRAIFWLNLAVALVLAVAIRGRQRPRYGRRGVLVGSAATLGCVALGLMLLAPARLATDLTAGLAFVPFAGGSRLWTPIGVTAFGLLVAAVAGWALLERGRIRRALAVADPVGALLLAAILAAVVLAFATADPERAVMASYGRVLLGIAAVLAVGFGLWQRRTPAPIVARGLLASRAAWGGLLVSLLTGGSLVAALVDIPVYARLTTYPDSQLGAALVLVRFLVGVPVGAVLGGWLTRRYGASWIAAAGLSLAALAFAVMTRWGAGVLTGPDALWSSFVLAACGVGFGVAIAPVNAAVLAAVAGAHHGLASALIVVARMIGMLVGISALTAIGLRRYYTVAAAVGTPAELCPGGDPARCRPFLTGLMRAGLSQVQTIFLGAAVLAALGAVCAVLLLREHAGAERT